jgi:hypothetical protein
MHCIENKMRDTSFFPLIDDGENKGRNVKFQNERLEGKTLERPNF